MTTFTITPSAVARINKLIAQDETALGLRVGVAGGGCSGFQYEIALATSALEDDLVIECDGSKVYIDPDSLPLLDGATLDFVDELGGSFFKINNPNATSRCGCGQSFSA